MNINKSTIMLSTSRPLTTPLEFFNCFSINIQHTASLQTYNGTPSIHIHFLPCILYFWNVLLLLPLVINLQLHICTKYSVIHSLSYVFSKCLTNVQYFFSFSQSYSGLRSPHKKKAMLGSPYLLTVPLWVGMMLSTVSC